MSNASFHPVTPLISDPDAVADSSDLQADSACSPARRAAPLGGYPGGSEQPPRSARGDPYGDPGPVAAQPAPRGEGRFFQDHKFAIIVSVIVLLIIIVVLYMYLTRKGGKRKKGAYGETAIMQGGLAEDGGSSGPLGAPGGDVDLDELSRLRELRRKTRGALVPAGAPAAPGASTRGAQPSGSLTSGGMPEDSAVSVSMIGIAIPHAGGRGVRTGQPQPAAASVRLMPPAGKEHGPPPTAPSTKPKRAPAAGTAQPSSASPSERPSERPKNPAAAPLAAATQAAGPGKPGRGVTPQMLRPAAPGSAPAAQHMQHMPPAGAGPVANNTSSPAAGGIPKLPAKIGGPLPAAHEELSEADEDDADYDMADIYQGAIFGNNPAPPPAKEPLAGPADDMDALIDELDAE